MEKNSVSQSAFLNSRLVIVLGLSAVAMLFAFMSVAPGRGLHRPAPPQSMPKISPWVLQQTASINPVEFLIVLAEQADLSGARSLGSKTEKGRFVRDTLWNKAQETQAPILQWLQDRHVEFRSFYIINAIWVKADASVVQTLAARADVARIEGNPQIHNAIPRPIATAQGAQPDQTTSGIEPGITYSHAPDVWSLGYTGQGIVVGGQDTGYRWTHNALKPHYRGWDGVAADHDYNWHDSIHAASSGNVCGSNSATPCDDNGHGTHTMGTAVGDDGAGNHVGMAPGAKWIGCRDMDKGNGTPATYLECFEFFLAPYPVGGTTAQGDPSKAPDLTTNSWGCPASEGCSVNDLKAAVEAQRAAGIMTVVAAGNAGSGCSTVDDQPSIFDAVYTIGALNNGTDTIASFSSRGPVTLDGSNRMKPDLCAPGTSVRSATRSSNTAYTTLQGTSMATPHVAGAVALLWSAQPALRHDVDRTEDILNQTAVHLNSNNCSSSGSPNNVFGYGRLDIKAAVDAALMQIRNLTNDGSAVTVEFYAIAGRTYQLERKIDIDQSSPPWQSVAQLTANITGLIPIVDPSGGSQPQAFYRVRILLP